MDKNTVYILQKDLPNAKAGDKYESTDSGENYINLNAMATWDVSYPKEYIENNSDWFVKEEVNESKPTEKKQWEDEDDDFLWTNKLAMELCEFVGMRVGKGIDIRQQVELLTEVFKQSKSKKEEPQWEILEIESYGGEIRKLIDGEYRLYTDGVGFTATYLLQRSDSKIKTVKRLSDGEVFSVGDVITGFSFNDGRKINRFSIQNGKLWISQKSGDCEIQHIKKVAPKEEQVPIKVEIMEFGYGKPQENKGNFYVANFNLPNNAKLPTEKYQSIKSAIEDVLNEDIKFKWHEFRPSPTEQQVNSPLFQAIWSVIKGWDIDTSDEKPRVNYHGANGSDVLLIMDSIKKMKLHTESELLQARRDAFDESRKNNPFIGFKHDNFEDYINSLK